MAKDLSKEQRLAEYLDQLAGGRQIDWNKVDPDLRLELEFAARMLENRDEAPQPFRNALRIRLVNKIARGEYSAQPGFWQKALTFGPGSPALRLATGIALVFLIVMGSAIWITYTSRPAQETAMAPAATVARPGGTANVLNLPANNVPADLKVSNSAMLSTVSAQANIYRVESPRVTSESVKELGNKLGLRGQAAYENDGKIITMRDGAGSESRQLTVWVASGAIQYAYTDFDRNYSSSASALPSVSQARKTAYDFLNKLSLLPSGYPDFTRIQNSMQVVQVSAPGQGGSSNLLVKFPYLVNGVQASGPGARIEVTLGNGGEVMAMLWAWRPVTSPSNVGVKSQDDAYQDLINGRGSLDVPSNTSTYNIERVDLSYWIEPFTERQDVILPVYVFKGESLDSNGNRLEDVDAWSSALR